MNTEANRSVLLAQLRELGAAAVAARQPLALSPRAARDRALLAAAEQLRARSAQILEANARDLQAARARQMSAALLDRLTLDPARVDAIARGLEAIAALPDPLGVVLADWTRPNGLRIQRISVPLGVIAIVYESRPNVTADAGALCLKSGNPVILRGGSESRESNRAIYECLRAGLQAGGLPEHAIQLVPTTDRAAVGMLLGELADYIDVVVPRGGRSLVERVQREARVPVIGHLEGICHVYVHEAADPEMARRVLLNSKMRRTGICGAAETVLFDRTLPRARRVELVQALLDAGCEVRGDEAVCELDSRVRPATEADWSTEYLDAIISARTVDGVDAALEHIARYGSAHTETIVTDDAEAAERFLRHCDSAIVLHNASTQFADGGEFGMGAEIGISTDRFHARGPVGVEQLTSYKYVVRGTGQIRP
ncbi:MAG: glutamate-5-semialdehyde dehydrogenase [Gammaproteobacteria bacterium]|nr:glutamate-5-semialdehyde dehydrogenase [Gammaproteobacteria bacterium]